MKTDPQQALDPETYAQIFSSGLNMNIACIFSDSCLQYLLKELEAETLE
jgi:hypothetical protein